ncbi:hypothetical protein GCM10027570_08700 [Streptomonospora sediminis]
MTSSAAPETGLPAAGSGKDGGGPLMAPPPPARSGSAFPKPDPVPVSPSGSRPARGPGPGDTAVVRSFGRYEIVPNR